MPTYEETMLAVADAVRLWAEGGGRHGAHRPGITVAQVQVTQEASPNYWRGLGGSQHRIELTILVDAEELDRYAQPAPRLPEPPTPPPPVDRAEVFSRQATHSRKIRLLKPS